MNQDLDVVMSEIHGMSQRGGSVSTELKIGEFNSSIIPDTTADMLLSFEPIETIRGLHKVNKDSKIVYNTHPIVPPSINEPYPSVDSITKSLKENFNHVLPIDATDLALDAGNILSLNMVLLGAVTADDKFPLSKDSVINAMKNNLHERFHDLNIKAIENGYQAAIMAPTEILAEQHYQSLSRLFAPLGLKTALLTGSMKEKEKRAALRQRA